MGARSFVEDLLLSVAPDVAVAEGLIFLPLMTWLDILSSTALSRFRLRCWAASGNRIEFWAGSDPALSGLLSIFA